MTCTLFLSITPGVPIILPVPLLNPSSDSGICSFLILDPGLNVFGTNVSNVFLISISSRSFLLKQRLFLDSWMIKMYLVSVDYVMYNICYITNTYVKHTLLYLLADSKFRKSLDVALTPINNKLNYIASTACMF